MNALLIGEMVASTLKQALVPRSLRHCASRERSLPGRTRGSDDSSWGLLYMQVAVSPLQIGIGLVVVRLKRRGSRIKLSTTLNLFSLLYTVIHLLVVDVLCVLVWDHAH